MNAREFSLPRPRRSYRLGGLFGLAVAVALFAAGCFVAGASSHSPAGAAAARSGAPAPGMVATDHFLFVLAGPTLYQFEVSSLKLRNQIPIPPAKTPEVDPNGQEGDKGPLKPPAQ